MRNANRMSVILAVVNFILIIFMMNLLKEWFGPRESISSIDFSGLLNPNCIESVHITAYKSCISERFIFSSSVTFNKDGNSFMKEFKGNSLNDVYQQVYNFCSEL